MNTLTWHDFQFALMRCPSALLDAMKSPVWLGKIFVGGGFLRAIVAGDEISDIDVFVASPEAGAQLALELVRVKIGEQDNDAGNANCQKHIHKTDNALTLTCFKPVLQIITRWVFDKPQSVAESFDFTCCCAVFWRSTEISWSSYCDERFYPDVAAKRLVYRNPVRNEDAGGSMLRVLKYYKKDYRIPLDSLGAVIARLALAVYKSAYDRGESEVATAITGLLREVDPSIDPTHVAHLPSEDVKTSEVAS